MRLVFMLVKDLISKSPFTINYGSSLFQAAQIMVEKNVGLLIIVDPNDQRKVLGVISERDFVKAFSKYKNLESLKVEDVGTMGNNVITIKQSDTIARAAQLMMEHNIRHLVVIDDENKLVGVISVRDIIKTNKILKAISEAH